MTTPTAKITIGSDAPQPVKVGAGGVIQIYVDARDADGNFSGHQMNLSSSDATIAKVGASVKGHAPATVSGIAAGTATVTATANDNAAITGTMTVTVT